MKIEDEINIKNRELLILHACSDAVIKCSTEASLLQELSDIITKKGGYSIVWIGVAENDPEKSVIPMVSSGEDISYLRKTRISWKEGHHTGIGPSGRAIRENQIIINNNITENPDLELWREMIINRNLGSCLTIPLRFRDEVFAIMNIYSTKPGAFNDQEVNLFVQVADYIALGITNIRNREEKKKIEEALEKRIISLTQPTSELSELSFTDLFNLEEIQKLQDAFAEATGVASIITDVNGVPITRPTNFCMLCKLIRETDKGLANCYHSDTIIGSKNPEGPTIQRCLSGGLFDAGASICVGDKHIANWLVGQVIDESVDENEILKYAGEVGIDHEEFKTALSQVKRMSQEQFKKICDALYIYATQLSKLALQNVQQAREITERKKSEDEKKALLSAIPDLILRMNKSGAIIDYSLPISLLGRQQLAGSIQDLLTPGMTERALNSINRTLSSAELQVDEFSSGEGEKKKHWESRMIKYGKDEVLTLVRDITARKTSELSLRKLSRAVEQSPVVIIITDLTGSIEYVNHKFTEVTGYSFEEVIGRNPRFLKSGETPASVYEDLWKTILDGREWTGEFHNKKKSGGLYWELVQISPIKNDQGEPTHFVALKEDISLRKQMEAELKTALEKAEEASRMKSALLGNMSHEFRTPLVSILGFANLLLDSLDQDEHRFMLEKIIRSAKRLTRTLNSILYYSEIATNTSLLQVNQVNLSYILKNIILPYSKMAAEKGLKFDFIEPTIGIEAFLDQNMFPIVIENLIENAIKFTHKGGVTVKLEYEDGANSQTGYAIISVEDTGIGIRPENMKIIFEEFRQLSEGFSRVYEGTGLGLTLSKKIIELLNGSLDVKSTYGQGSTFYLRIPAVHPSKWQKSGSKKETDLQSENKTRFNR